MNGSNLVSFQLTFGRIFCDHVVGKDCLGGRGMGRWGNGDVAEREQTEP